MIFTQLRGEMWHVFPNGVKKRYSMSIAMSEGQTSYIPLALEILLSIVAGSTARLPVCDVTINH